MCETSLSSYLRSTDPEAKIYWERLSRERFFFKTGSRYNVNPFLFFVGFSWTGREGGS